MNESDPLKPEERRPFQFSLRTLLIAVLVLGVFFGWLGSRLQRAARHRQVAAELQEVVAKLRNSGGRVLVSTREVNPGWLENLLHDPGIECILSVHARSEFDGGGGSRFGDTGMERLKGLTDLQLLSIIDGRVTDAGLGNLKGLPSLDTLQIGGHQPVTPEFDFRSLYSQGYRVFQGLQGFSATLAGKPQ